jgi:RNA polymerase sigma-70 factor (ECF subfamily)
MDESMRISVSEIPEGQSQVDVFVAEAKSDPQAFAQLYDLYVQPVYRYLLSKIGNQQEAEDITAQTFLAALQGFPRYMHRGNFAAWLFSIARNKMADYYRRQRNHRSLEEGGGNPAGTAWMQDVIRTERALDLSELINKLPEDEQELLRLRFVAQMRFREIASLNGKNESAVKKAVYRLLARLQSQLEDYRE